MEVFGSPRWQLPMEKGTHFRLADIERVSHLSHEALLGMRSVLLWPER